MPQWATMVWPVKALNFIGGKEHGGVAQFVFLSEAAEGVLLHLGLEGFVPTGNTQFQFNVANLNFKSTSYDWLVIAGAKAQFKGTGTINGKGTSSFLLTAVDGDQLGKGKSDLFRIKIWEKTTGTIVYDNQLGATDTADPTTVLGGGSIVVHK